MPRLRQALGVAAPCPSLPPKLRRAALGILPRDTLSGISERHEDEAAFYAALADNDSAKKVMGDAGLAEIAREPTKNIRVSVTVDWTVRENVRAENRVKVKRILWLRGYPPDAQARAVDGDEAGGAAGGGVGGVGTRPRRPRVRGPWYPAESHFRTRRDPSGLIRGG